MAEKRVGGHLIVWRIENFSACCNSSLISPATRAKHLDDTLWKVELSPVCKRGDHCLVYLHRAAEDDGPVHITLQYELCLIDVFGRKIPQRRSLLPNFANESKAVVKLDRDWIREGKELLLPNDALTLECRLSKPGRRSHGAYRSVVRTTIPIERLAFLWTIRKASAIERVVRVDCSTLPRGFELACEYEQQQNTPERGRALRLSVTPKEATADRTFVSVAIRSPRGQLEAEHFFEEGSNDAWRLPSFDGVEVLPEGDLLDLACEFTLSDGCDVTQTEETSMLPAEPTWEANTLRHQIRSMYETCTDSDILVETDDRSESFNAHKMILSARSLLLRRALRDFCTKKHCDYRHDAYFLDCFNARSVGVVKRGCRIFISTYRGSDSVMISGLRANVVEQMLQCMYTDDLDPRGASDAQELYEAGVTFEFKLLREKSLGYLKSHLNIREIYSTLVFADAHGCFRLRSDCVDFISKNSDYLLTSSEWRRFRADHKRLSNRVLDAHRSEVGTFESTALDPIYQLEFLNNIENFKQVES